MPTLQKPDLKKQRLFSITTTLIVDTLVFVYLSLRRNKKKLRCEKNCGDKYKEILTHFWNNNWKELKLYLHRFLMFQHTSSEVINR